MQYTPVQPVRGSLGSIVAVLSHLLLRSTDKPSPLSGGVVQLEGRHHARRDTGSGRTGRLRAATPHTAGADSDRAGGARGLGPGTDLGVGAWQVRPALP